MCFAAFGLLFRGLESIFRWIGRRIGSCYYRPLILLIQAALAYGASIFCAIEVEHWSLGMISMVVVGGVCGLFALFTLYREFYVQCRNFMIHNAGRFRALFLIVHSVGFLGALKLFVLISNEIGKDQHLAYLYSIGFLLSTHLSIVSIAKMFGADDFFGVADSLMAVAMMLWVNFPEDRLEVVFGKKIAEWAWVVYYGVCLLLVLFKNSEIQVRGLLDVPEVPGQVQLVPDPDGPAPTAILPNVTVAQLSVMLSRNLGVAG